MIRPRRGFTLIEVLVASAIIFLLAASLGRFVVDLFDSRDRLERSMERQRSADALFLALERALATTVVEDALLGAGVRGSAESLDLVMRGVPAWRLGDPATRGRALEDRERLSIRGGFGVAAPASVRRGEGRGEASGEVAATVRFRYHDGDAWHERFDSLERGMLPRAIEVSVWWHRAQDAVDPGDLSFAEEDAGEDEQRETSEPAAAESDGAEQAGGERGSIGVAREDLGGPARAPDRVRIIPIPDSGEGTQVVVEEER